MAGFGTTASHSDRKAVLAGALESAAPKADGSVVAIKHGCSLSVARV